MTPERLRAIETLFHQAREQTPGERDGFLASACADDPALRAEVESLLAQPAGGVIDAPLGALVAVLVTPEPPLAPGSSIGAYRIERLLDVGGMGEVYRAHDTTLGRDVAIKILPRHFTADVGRLARFEREARFLATLNHPHVASIYGVVEDGGVRGLVLELVDGPTLADRLTSGPLPIVEALRIASQIAEALEAAHDKGVVHRDLKPANIKVTTDGIVKVLDFGLAKTVDAAAIGSDGDEAATPNTDRTTPGLIIGTTAYMSPEQARGAEVTRRTDVWAFGAILFEMLTGRRPFGGATASDVLAAILRATPDWSALPANTPPPITRLVRRCLERDPKARLHDIGDARLEIEDAMKALEVGAAIDVSPRSDRGTARGASRHILLGAAAVLVVAAVAAAAYVLGSRRGAAAAQEVRLDMPPPNGTHFVSVPAVAPDSRQIAFVTAPNAGGASRLWIRPLAADSATALAGTEDASYPFWSPDSRSVAFFANGKLKRINLAGGSPIVLGDAEAGRGGAWLDDGSIVFAPSQFTALMRIPAGGGDARPFTKLTEVERSHRFPERVPGGRLLYFSLNRTPQKSGTRLIAIDSPGDEINFFETWGNSRYVNGFLSFERRLAANTGALLAQRLALPGGQLTGDPIQIGTSRVSETLGRAVVSSAPAGVIAFQAPPDAIGQFTWFSRDGRSMETIGAPIAQLGVELSATGQQVATFRRGFVWVLDLARPVANRVTPEYNRHPIWSPDGSRIASLFQGRGINTFDIAATSVTTEKLETLSQRPALVRPMAWTRDGRTIVFTQNAEKGDAVSIWTMPVADPANASAYLQDGARNLEARLSPDDKWIAYATDRSGRFEIEVQSFSTPGTRYPVSLQGGGYPRWRRDGRELYYLSADSHLMAVAVTPGDPPTFGSPVPLFEVKPVAHSDRVYLAAYEYDVSADGSRFLINRQIAEPVTSMTVVLNWSPPSSTR